MKSTIESLSEWYGFSFQLKSVLDDGVEIWAGESGVCVTYASHYSEGYHAEFTSVSFRRDPKTDQVWAIDEFFDWWD